MTSGPRFLPARPLLASALSCCLVAAVLWTALPLDLFVARYVRSLHSPWLEAVGDAGTRLGSGPGLVLLSLALLATGMAIKHALLRLVAIQTLLAHGAAALVTQVLKHTIARPRPRMLHGNETFPWHPSLESGLDSFPSGHTSASFALATVAANHFPRWAWCWYGLAVAVAVSRVIRGSHYPTDILAGMVVGILVATIIVHPLRDWRRSLVQGLSTVVPIVIGAFAVLWLTVHRPDSLGLLTLMPVLGIMAITVGLGLRSYSRIMAQRPRVRAAARYAPAVIALGLALMTGFLVIVVFTLTAIAIHLLSLPPAHAPDLASPAGGEAPWRLAAVQELAVLIGLGLGVVVMWMLRGLVPIG